jgi:hypothetical protein
MQSGNLFLVNIIVDIRYLIGSCYHIDIAGKFKPRPAKKAFVRKRLCYFK